MRLTINGQRGAFLQPTRYGFDTSGPYAIFVWKGTKDECLANVPAIEASGGLWEMRESYSGSGCELEARFPTEAGFPEEKPESTWELFPTDADQDILDSDVAVVKALSQTDREKIRAAIYTPKESSPSVSGNALEMYLLMLDGIKVWKTNAPTLRHTQKVSRAFAIQSALTNVNRILRTSTLLTQEPTIPSGLSANLPTVVNSSSENFKYGWQKKYPQITAAAGARVHIVQEWQWGRWPFGNGQFTPLSRSLSIYGDLL